MTYKYAAELAPIPRLVVDMHPPLATKVWLISEFGTGYAGNWHSECRAVAWSPLPKLTPAQKTRLAEMRKLDQDPTIPKSNAAESLSTTA